MPIYPPTPRTQLMGAKMVPMKASSPSSTTTTTTTTTSTPTTQLPNAPGSVTLAQASGGGLTVTWSAAVIDSTHDAATGYNLQYSPTGMNTWTVVPSVTSPYALTGLAAGIEIDVQVQSTNAAGTGAWSATSTLATLVGEPNPPNGLELAQGTGSSLIATWAAPTIDSSHNAAISYNLQYSPSGANTWTAVTPVVSPYTITGLSAGESTDVQVQGVNSAGTGAWTATTTLSTVGAAPNTPGGLTLANGTGSNLTVSWTVPLADSTHGAATSYNVRSGPSGANNWTTVTALSSPYTLTGLSAGAAIDVEVQAANATGTSAWSGTSTLTTTAEAPNMPTGLTLAQGGGSDLTVTWTASATDSLHGAATSYNLRSSLSGANAWTTVTGVTSPYDLSGLAASTAIDVEIQAANAAGTSAWSAISTLTTGSGGVYAPNVPTISSVAAPADGTAGKLVVTWATPAPDSTHGAATGYNIRTSPTGANTWTTVTGVTSPYTLTNLTGGAAIDVEVQATNAAASPGAWSAITTATSWGATVAVGGLQAATTQTHGASVSPGGGANMTVIAAPTAVASAAFAWSTSQSVVPTSGLISAGGDGQTNGYGAYFDAPASAGTYYLWMLAQGTGATTIGALVTSAITVS